MKLHTIAKELRIHAPFTAFGTLTGIVIMAVIIHVRLPRETSSVLFWMFHPLHVVLSALVTAGMYRLHSTGTLWRTVVIGYFGAIGIATLSDSIIPYVGEIILDLPNRGIHLGVIEKWWLVNPLALAGIALAYIRPQTKFPHAIHVLLSTWASLFHITMAMGTELNVCMAILVAVFMFLAVWVPCCTSDIVFPLLFAKEQKDSRA
ncbi:MAG: hypothetical protein ACP5HU_10050 [Phycisphaerae bacterium]